MLNSVPTQEEVEERKGAATAANSLLEETMMAEHHHKQVMADWHASEQSASAEGIALAAERAARQKDLYAAFKVFDADNSGKLTFGELKAILQRNVPGNTPMSDADIRGLIERVDGSLPGSEKDGMLDVREFVKAMTEDEDAQEVVTGNDKVVSAQYQRRFDENKDAIKELFKALDTDGSGHVDVHELEPVATLLHGEAFVKEDYLSWYDSNGKGDGKFDLKEFGWYVADCANCEADKMEEWIAKMKEAIVAVKGLRS